MSKRIITISREFGSGGRTIGKLTAKALGIPCYDKDLIEKIAKESGLSEEFISKQGEYAPNKSIFSYAFLGRDITGMSVNDHMWIAQQNIIKELAEKGPCVIVGRCADYILRGRDDCLNVFVHAPVEFKAERIVRLYGENEEAPEKRLKEKDRRRKLNYEYFTEQKWGDTRNYHLCIDSSVVGIERSAEILALIAKEK